jgi:hypothetical protein
MPTTYDTLEMGACNVSFKATDLGLTKGGVEVEFGTETAPINADQLGDTLVNEVIKGRSIKVKVPLAERDLTKLAAVIPGSTLVGTGANRKLVVRAAAGTSLRALAGVLILHPKDRAVGDKTADVTIPLAMCKGDFQFAYKHDDQRVYSVEFTGFADLSTDELFTLGDPAVVAA